MDFAWAIPVVGVFLAGWFFMMDTVWAAILSVAAMLFSLTWLYATHPASAGQPFLVAAGYLPIAFLVLGACVCVLFRAGVKELAGTDDANVEIEGREP